MFLGGLSWEGFGAFLGIVLSVEMWKYLRTDTDTELSYFAVWVLSFVPWLYICSPAYRSGVGWSTHLFASMLLPPVTLLTVGGVRQWLLGKRTSGSLQASSLTVIAVADAYHRSHLSAVDPRDVCMDDRPVWQYTADAKHWRVSGTPLWVLDPPVRERFFHGKSGDESDAGVSVGAFGTSDVSRPRRFLRVCFIVIKWLRCAVRCWQQACLAVQWCRFC